MQFPIGSQVKLSMYTGDDQIDHYYGQTLIVSEYREISYLDTNSAGRTIVRSFPNYSLTTPNGFEITANEYELEVL